MKRISHIRNSVGVFLANQALKITTKSYRSTLDRLIRGGIENKEFLKDTYDN